MTVPTYSPRKDGTGIWEDEGVEPVPCARPRCYVASPLGFTEAGRAYYAATYLPALSRVVEPVDPWSMVSAEEIDQARANGEQRKLWLSIGARNAEAIRSVGLLAAYLEGQEADSGTVAEVGYAVGRGVRCFGLRSDLRQAGEVGVALNLQVEALIIESGGMIVATLDALLDALADARADAPFAES